MKEYLELKYLLKQMLRAFFPSNIQFTTTNEHSFIYLLLFVKLAISKPLEEQQI
jgi:hypothetical protein